MSEQEIEKEIKRKGLNAPRLCPEDIDKAIVSETFTVMPSGKAMVCELTLSNGFTVRGETACVSKENFDVEIGERISRENARKKVWELEGYRLQCELAGPKVDPSLPPIGDGPRREILIRVSVPEDWENRLDMQAVLEREIKADRWAWISSPI